MPSLRRVLIGLRLSSLGIWAVTSAGVLLVSLSLLAQVTFTTGYSPLSIPSMIVVVATHHLSYAALGVGLLGLVVSFIGRCRCQGVAGAIPSARIRLAVIFEACSLLSAAAFVGVSSLLAPLPPLMNFTWVVFIGLTAYLARMKFLQFTHSIAETTSPVLVPEVAAVQRLYLYVPGGFVMAFGMVPTGRSLASFTDNEAFVAGGVVFAWLTATSATVFAVILVWRWTAMLANLRTAVALAARHEEEVGDDNDPDAEYRRRYHKRESLPT